MRSANARAVERLLGRREGVLHRSELRAVGVDDALADREVAAGRWCRPVPEVLVAARVPSRRQLMVAGVLHARPTGLLTGTAAAELYGLRDVPPARQVDVLLPHEVRRVSTHLVRVRRTTSPPPTRVLVQGLPAVRPARALVDAVTGGLGLRDARALLLGAVADDLVDVAELEADLSVSGRRGLLLARRVVLEAGEGLASAPEAEAADLLRPWARRRGLVLLFNPWLMVGGRVLGRPDAYMPALGVGVESDSVRHHGDGLDLARTLQRHGRLSRAGLLLGHETSASVRGGPAAVLERLEADVARRAAEPWQPPSGLEVLRHDDPRAPRRRASRWWDLLQEPAQQRIG